MEPFEIANAKPILDFQEIEPNMPTNVCASIDLEYLVTLQDQGVGAFLTDLLTDPSKPGYRIATGLKDHSLGRNELSRPIMPGLRTNGVPKTGWSPPQSADGGNAP